MIRRLHRIWWADEVARSTCPTIECIDWNYYLSWRRLDVAEAQWTQTLTSSEAIFSETLRAFTCTIIDWRDTLETTWFILVIGRRRIQRLIWNSNDANVSSFVALETVQSQEFCFYEMKMRFLHQASNIVYFATTNEWIEKWTNHRTVQ